MHYVLITYNNDPRYFYLINRESHQVKEFLKDEYPNSTFDDESYVLTTERNIKYYVYTEHLENGYELGGSIQLLRLQETR